MAGIATVSRIVLAVDECVLEILMVTQVGTYNI